MSDAPKKEEVLSFSQVMNKAAASALRGGTAGAIAMGANVGALMWMRTTVSTIHSALCFIVDEAHLIFSVFWVDFLSFFFPPSRSTTNIAMEQAFLWRSERSTPMVAFPVSTVVSYRP